MDNLKIVLGPYRCGKSTHLLAEMLSYCRSTFPFGKQALLVVPSKRYQGLVERRIAALLRKDPSGATGLVGLRIFPFYDVCTDALRREGIIPRIIPEAVRPAIVSRVLAKMKIMERLEHLAPIIEYAGTHGAILDLIDEFERSGLSPKDVIASVQSSASQHSRQIELAQVYELYWQELEKIEYADNRMLAFKCREVLAKRERTEAMYGFVGVDGFDRFSKLQLQVLEQLVHHSQRAEICFDYVDEINATTNSAGGAEGNETDQVNRIEYVWKQSSFQELKETFPASQHHWLELEAERFDAARGKDCFHTVDRFLEMEEVARRVKSSLLINGSKPSDVAVLVPSMRPYKSAIESAFEEAQIPYYIDEPIPIASLPIVQFLVKLLTVGVESFPRRVLVDLLKSRLFNLKMFGLSPTDVRLLDRQSIDDGIVSGATRWLECARKLQLKERLEPLISYLTPPDSRRLMSKFVAWSEDVITKCLVLDTDLEFKDPDLLWVEERALLEVKNCFAALVQEDLILHGKDNGLTVDFATYAQKLAHVIERANFRMRRLTAESVTICSVDLIENRLFDEIHIAGLNEGEFPRRLRARGFVAPDEVARWASYGVDIFNPRMHPSFEQALFYSLMGRAREKVSFSYPLWNMSGDELLPSFFLTGELNGIKDVELKPFEKALTRPTSPRNFLAAQLWPGGLTNYYKDELTEELERKLAERMMMAGSRIDGTLQSPCNGYLVDAVQAGVLTVNVPARFSASKLNEYGKCPFRYWVSQTLKIEPLEEPVASIDARILGETYHLALELFYSRVISSKTLVCLENVEELKEIFAVAMKEAIEWLEETPATAQSEFWEYERKEIEFRLWRFFDKEIERADKETTGLAPYMVEASFGMDDENSAPPLRLSDERRTVEIRGKIDRIDIEGAVGEGSNPPARGVTARVIDYKAGSSFIGKREALEGRNLQLPIYALAVERCLLPGSLVKEGQYLSVSSARSIGSLQFDGGEQSARPNSSWREKGESGTRSGSGSGDTHRDVSDPTDGPPDLRNLTEKFVLDYVERLSLGVFTVQPSAPSVCASCDHSRVCRITELKGAGERHDVTD